MIHFIMNYNLIYNYFQYFYNYNLIYNYKNVIYKKCKCNRFLILKNGTTAGSLVSSSSTATGSSEISESDAYNNAYSIASSVAQSVANNNANIINQAVKIVQDYSPVTFGVNSGYTGQGIHSIAIGDGAGSYNQGTLSVAIGNYAANNTQGNQSIAMGYSAGYIGQSGFSIAIGNQAGEYNQGGSSIAIGADAAKYNQNDFSLAIGNYAGRTGQGSSSIAIGSGAGQYNQGNNSVAIGSGAGTNNQGTYSIAIGTNSGNSNQPANSIILNANETQLNLGSTGFFVKPINSSTDTVALVYESSTGRITYNNTLGSSKTFVIDHPVNPEKYLVHACLEGPEAGVYYRGKGEIKEGALSEIIELPNYVSSFATDLTVQVTPIYNGKINILNASEVENNSFTVYGESSCKFNWIVYGKRSSINIEPYKDDC
jgi:hypothetical protein